MNGKISKFKAFGAWEYEKEEQMLNEASRKGLQLVKGGIFRSLFFMDDSVRYIYQMDYNKHISDPVRYREIFTGHGWEYVNSAANGWHYFRKPYEDCVDASESRIYTDQQSLMEMHRRWMWKIAVTGIVSIIMAIVYLFMGISERVLSLTIEGAIFTILSFTMGFSFLGATRKQTGERKRITIPMQWVTPIVALLIIVSMFSIFINNGVHDTAHLENFVLLYTGQEQLPNTLGDYVIEKSGYYKLSLTAKIEGGEMEIVITNENGDVVFNSTVSNSGEMGNHDIYLKRGIYQTNYKYSFDEDFDYNGTEISIDLALKR